MGVKDWLAKHAAGPSGFGTAFVGSVVENGIALGRVLFIGHGTSTATGKRYIFEDDEEMKRCGFDVYCDNPLNPPPVEDESQLSKHARAAGIAFAARLAINAVENYFAAASNRDQFSRAMGQRTQVALLEIGCGVTFDLVLHYTKLPFPEGVDRMLNLDKPGNGDVLDILLRELGAQVPGKSVGFQRSGANGFDLVVVPLAEKTVLGIKGAADQYSW